jgi:hypothetical protein
MSTPNLQFPTPKEPFPGRRWQLAASVLFGSWVLGVGSSGAQAPVAVLDNEHVRVTRNDAPCAAAGPACGDRIIVRLGDVERGQVRVFKRGERYDRPGGEFLEVAVKTERPPIKSPSVLIPPDKNSILYDGDDFFIFEEKLGPGDTRARHSHRERVVIVINRTRLQQWPDGAAELLRDQVPDDVRFNPPVVHVVKTVGDLPLRNIVIEFKR